MRPMVRQRFKLPDATRAAITYELWALDDDEAEPVFVPAGGVEPSAGQALRVLN